MRPPTSERADPGVVDLLGAERDRQSAADADRDEELSTSLHELITLRGSIRPQSNQGRASHRAPAVDAAAFHRRPRRGRAARGRPALMHAGVSCLHVLRTPGKKADEDAAAERAGGSSVDDRSRPRRGRQRPDNATAPMNAPTRSGHRRAVTTAFQSDLAQSASPRHTRKASCAISARWTPGGRRGGRDADREQQRRRADAEGHAERYRRSSCAKNPTIAKARSLEHPRRSRTMSIGNHMIAGPYLLTALGGAAVREGCGELTSYSDVKSPHPSRSTAAPPSAVDVRARNHVIADQHGG